MSTLQPAPPAEHAHAGHPALRKIAEAVRDGQEVWSPKELELIFPGMSIGFYIKLCREARLEAQAHSCAENTRPTYRISTRSLVVYFVQTMTGLTQADMLEALSLVVPRLSRKALEWLRARIDRELARLRVLNEVSVPVSGEIPPSVMRPRTTRADAAQPELFQAHATQENNTHEK